MNRAPPQAIAPLRERLAQLRNTPAADIQDATRTAIAIDQLEQLIKRLENPTNVPRSA